MTRAMERLLVSGSVGRQARRRETPIGWALGRLGLEEIARCIGGARGGGARIGDRRRARGHGTARPGGGGGADRGSARDGARDRGVSSRSSRDRERRFHRRRRGCAADGGARAAYTGSRLSFSALALFERCSYRRYYAERVAGMQPTAWSNGEGLGDGERRLRHTEIGDAVHRLLELVDLARPAAPKGLEAGSVMVGRHRAEARARSASLVGAYCARRSRSGLAGLDGVQVERPFAFVLDDVLLNGRLDVLWRSVARARARLQDERPRGP